MVSSGGPSLWGFVILQINELECIFHVSHVRYFLKLGFLGLFVFTYSIQLRAPYGTSAREF